MSCLGLLTRVLSCPPLTNWLFMSIFLRFVGLFISRKERLKELGHDQRFTNVYVKNFGEDVGDEQLYNMFAQFGNVISHVVMKDRNTGRSKGFGFVSFDTHEGAAMVSITIDNSDMMSLDVCMLIRIEVRTKVHCTGSVCVIMSFPV